MNASDLEGCYSLSNSISVERNNCSGIDGIVINEIAFNGDVEIINTSNASIDVSSYWLCEFPNYVRFSDAFLVCGADLVLDPVKFWF